MFNLCLDLSDVDIWLRLMGTYVTTFNTVSNFLTIAVSYRVCDSLLLLCCGCLRCCRCDVVRVTSEQRDAIFLEEIIANDYANKASANKRHHARHLQCGGHGYSCSSSFLLSLSIRLTFLSSATRSSARSLVGLDLLNKRCTIHAGAEAISAINIAALRGAIEPCFADT